MSNTSKQEILITSKNNFGFENTNFRTFPDPFLAMKLSVIFNVYPTKNGYDVVGDISLFESFGGGHKLKFSVETLDDVDSYVNCECRRVLQKYHADALFKRFH